MTGIYWSRLGVLHLILVTFFIMTGYSKQTNDHRPYYIHSKQLKQSFGANWWKVLPLLKLKHPSSQMTILNQNDTISNVAYEKASKEIAEDVQYISKVSGKNSSEGEDIKINNTQDSDLNVTVEEELSDSGNQLRGWLFNTFQATTTKLPEPSETASCDDTSRITILNKSVSCDHSGTSDNNALRKISFNDNQLLQYMSDEGGSFVKQYMAMDQGGATANFKNMISLTEQYVDTNFKRHPHDWVWDYDETKAKLIENLEVSHFQMMSAIAAASKGSRSNPYTDEHHTTWGNQNQYNHWLSKSNRIGILHHLLPAKYLYTPQQRYKREADGTTSKMEYCQNRGKETADGYLHLCTMCAHTTTLPSDRFPRVINEAVCHSTESGCMFVGSTPHGSCRQTVFYMNMLRKKAGSCMMVIHDGQTVLTDEWEIYSQPIRVSCECLVNKRSPIAKNVNPN